MVHELFQVSVCLSSFFMHVILLGTNISYPKKDRREDELCFPFVRYDMLVRWRLEGINIHCSNNFDCSDSVL